MAAVKESGGCESRWFQRFTYKQQGKDAISLNNVFFYVTYEGAVDIYKIQDPVQRHAVEDQVAYFGQTPSRLLTVPHISKIVNGKYTFMKLS
ncbi:putative BEACH domain-containing protein [Helianthus annuus]|nr:putative BEACH domain-containing protein [Helianthus annuus]KAJ0936320.1 putative BEACH domain-containing protein [Helianthus annuus]